MTADLIERLRAKWRAAPVLGGGSLNGPCYIRDDGMRLRNPDGPEAADELSALRERVEALEGAARAVCDGQATPASVNNLRAILAQQGGEDG